MVSGDEEKRLLEAAECLQKAPHIRPIIIVDFDSMQISIPKTKNSEMRHIPMNSTLSTALEGWCEERTDGDRVFPVKCVKRSWATARRNAGIPSHCRFHDLRHTFASRLVMARVDLRTVQELMGHKDIKMTMRYAHLTAEHKRQAVEVLTRKSTEVGTNSAQMQFKAAGEIP